MISWLSELLYTHFIFPGWLNQALPLAVSVTSRAVKREVCSKSALKLFWAYFASIPEMILAVSSSRGWAALQGKVTSIMVEIRSIAHALKRLAIRVILFPLYLSRISMALRLYSA